MEHELEASPVTSTQNAVFDETGHFLLYSSLLGIKVVNVETNRVVRVLGKIEAGERFLHVALFQGVPKVDSQLVKALSKGKTASTVEEMRAQLKPDPTVVATAFKKRRFYLFTRRMPVRGYVFGVLFVVLGSAGSVLDLADSDWSIYYNHASTHTDPPLMYHDRMTPRTTSTAATCSTRSRPRRRRAW